MSNDDEIKEEREPDHLTVEDPQTEIEQLSEHLREYVGIRRELFELKLWDKLFSTTAAALTWIVIAFLAIISFFLFSAGIAFWIGTAIGHAWIGFLIVAGVYAVLATVLFFARDKLIQKPLTNRFIDKLVNDDDDEEQDIGERPHHEQKAA